MNLLELFKKQVKSEVETITNEHGEQIEIDWYLKSLKVDIKFCQKMFDDLAETLGNLKEKDIDLKMNIESDIRRYKRLGKEFQAKYNKHKGRLL